MHIRQVQPGDKAFWLRLDAHGGERGFEDKLRTGRGYVVCGDDGVPVGLLHFCLIWDQLPFLNLIYFPETHRGKGFGSFAMRAWEEEMRAQGAKMVLISTQVDEEAQHFYRRLGYVDCGGLVLSGTPFDQPMEMFMRKTL